MKVEKISEYTDRELMLRLVFWKRVLIEHLSRISKAHVNASIGMCCSIQRTAQKFGGFCGLYSSNFSAEFLKYKPKSLYREDTDYWWNPTAIKGTRQRRVKVLESIIADLEQEVLNRSCYCTFPFNNNL